MKYLLIFSFFLVMFAPYWGKSQSNGVIALDSNNAEVIQSQAFLNTIEQSLQAFYAESLMDNANYDLSLYDDKFVTFPDSVYCERLNELNKLSPFHLDCNKDVLNTIDFFVRKRRKFIAVVMGRSALYFNLYEEKLADHNMPIELKYLSVIESGLRPQVKSRAGALGLWQFMYRTGKMYGLTENSYIDERMDPVKATEAACKYLKFLHGLYDDWNMALAAYNAGPGNVNKAIRRSGGKMTYWEIRPYLPRETQGYVPNFIAVSYLMNYYDQHNIKPIPAVIHDFQVDTVCLKGALHFETIDSLIGWSKEDIFMLNPIYKTPFIPETEPAQCISIPNLLLEKWISFEDSLYVLEDSIYNSVIAPIENENRKNQDEITHIVRSGESLSVIANKYSTSVNKIMDWNNLRSTKLRVGQKLVIYGKNPPKKSNNVVQNSSNDKDAKYHTVRSGDNYWEISKKYGTNVATIESLNPNLNPTDLKIGQKVRVK